MTAWIYNKCVITQPYPNKKLTYRPKKTTMTETKRHVETKKEKGKSCDIMESFTM